MLSVWVGEAHNCHSLKLEIKLEMFDDLLCQCWEMLQVRSESPHMGSFGRQWRKFYSYFKIRLEGILKAE